MKSQNETFGTFLKSLRTKRKLSLREAADIAGVSKMYISQLERDKASNPTMSTMEGLSSAYNASIKKMFDAWASDR